MKKKPAFIRWGLLTFAATAVLAAPWQKAVYSGAGNPRNYLSAGAGDGPVTGFRLV